MRDENEAADAVQDACLRAFRFIGGFRGGDGGSWLLAIVRNTCFKRRAGRENETEFDDEIPNFIPGPKKSVGSGIFRPARRSGLVKATRIRTRTPEEIVDYRLSTITPRRGGADGTEELKTETHKSFFPEGLTL
jgi:DNA-directed RNA polymerase specialized sigma24 family protein